ncbi:MAG: hypothetical protein AB7P18_26665 [Candidatus Binatia bacterium]
MPKEIVPWPELYAADEKRAGKKSQKDNPATKATTPGRRTPE